MTPLNSDTDDKTSAALFRDLSLELVRDRNNKSSDVTTPPRPSTGIVLNQEQSAEASKIAKEMNVGDELSIVDFAFKKQTDLAALAESWGTTGKLGDAGKVGELFAELEKTFEKLCPNPQDKKRHIAVRVGKALVNNTVGFVPLIGSRIAGVSEKAIDAMTKISEVRPVAMQIITTMLEQVALLKADWGKLNVIADKTEKEIQNLGVLAVAAETRHLKEKEDLERRAMTLPTHELRKASGVVRRLGERAHNLVIAYNAAQNGLLALRIEQETLVDLVHLVQDGVAVMVPEWDRQLQLAITAQKTGVVKKMAVAARHATGEAMKANAAQVQKNRLDVIELGSQGVLPIEALILSVGQIAETIRKGAELQSKQDESWKKNEKELAKAQTAVRNAMHMALAITREAASGVDNQTTLVAIQ